MRCLWGLFCDLMLLPLAALLTLYEATIGTESEFDNSDDNDDIPPILLLHGAGFNQSEWIVARYYLKKAGFRSIWSLNMDHVIRPRSNSMGIREYAYSKVRPFVRSIIKKTGKREIVIIGHSMGGLVGAYYKQCFAARDDVVVKMVITISTPWHGAPLLSKFAAHSKNTARVDMTPGSELLSLLHSLTKPYAHEYRYVTSTADWAVPGSYGISYARHTKQYLIYDWLGHYWTVLYPETWHKVVEWLKDE